MQAGCISQWGAHITEHRLQSKVKGTQVNCQRSCSAKVRERNQRQQATSVVGHELAKVTVCAVVLDGVESMWR